MNKARRAERLRRAPKTVMGNDTSEPIADRHLFQRSRIRPRSIAVCGGLREIGRVEISIDGGPVAFAADGTRLGEFPNEAAAMRAITDSAKAKERCESPSMSGCAHHRPDRARSI
jgi:hypothetical protein